MRRRNPAPAVQALEPRVLLSVFATSNNYAAREAQAQHLDDDYVNFLKTIELHSQATSAEYNALRDDALAISQAASTTTLPLATADAKAVGASTLIDRAFLEGFLDDGGWQKAESRLETTLDGLNVPQAVIDRTIADMKAAAQSAGVSSGAYLDLEAKAENLHAAEVSLPSGYTHFQDPQLYYTQHLRGFIRGGTAAKNAARDTLQGDVTAIAPGNATVKRDVALLEQVGSRISGDAFGDVATAYQVAFANGPPDPAASAPLKSSLTQAVGTTTQPAATASAINRLASGAPAFFQAVGSSANATTILDDVATYLAAGGSAPINPFRVQIVRPVTSP